MLSHIACHFYQGVTYASVNDCYWNHPSTVEVMNEVCREQFKALHSQPILEDLSESFIKTYLGSGTSEEWVLDSRFHNDLRYHRANLLFTSIPTKGSLDLSVVKDSVYFFN